MKYKKASKKVSYKINKKTTPPVEENTGNKIDIKIINNFVALIAILAIIFIIYFLDPGYKWTWNDLIKSNLEVMSDYKNTDYNKRAQLKLGYFADYMSILRENTPEDAIILMPSDSVINTVKNKLFIKHLKNKTFTTYFLYPRKVVYEKNKDDNEFFDKATHIAIVNYNGYDKTNKEIAEKVQFFVLPIE